MGGGNLLIDTGLHYYVLCFVIKYRFYYLFFVTLPREFMVFKFFIKTLQTVISSDIIYIKCLTNNYFAMAKKLRFYSADLSEKQASLSGRIVDVIMKLMMKIY